MEQISGGGVLFRFLQLTLAQIVKPGTDAVRAGECSKILQSIPARRESIGDLGEFLRTTGEAGSLGKDFDVRLGAIERRLFEVIMSVKQAVTNGAPGPAVEPAKTEIVLAKEQQVVLKSSNRPARRDRSET